MKVNEATEREETAAVGVSPLQAVVGQLAIKEYEAWIARNAARAKLRAFLSDYRHETGEWFDKADAEPEDVAKFEELRAPAVAAQKALTTARHATRRSAKKALPNAAPQPTGEPGTTGDRTDERSRNR